MESLACRDTVRKLLVELLQDVELARVATIAGQVEFPDSPILSGLLGERLAEMYFRALGEMSRELVPQHVGQCEANDALWALFREVAADPASYHDRVRRKRRLDRFIQDVKKPLYAFEVAYSIGDLDLGDQVFSIGPVRFFTMDDNEATLWGLTQDNSAASHMRADVMHHPAAAVEVQAADDRRALETGLAQVTSSMDLLRLAGVIGVISAFDDRLFLWRLNGRAITRQITLNQPSVTYHRQHQFRPLIAEMGSHIKKGLDPELSSLQAIANGELPDEISRRLERAISWISSSVTRQRLDDKVVDLCTALEVLLLPNYRGGKKGHVIALRHRLIGGDWNPIGILTLYDLRSHIVHGSVLNVSQHLDYWRLLVICVDTLNRVVDLAKRNPMVQNLEELIGTVETKEKLGNFLYLLDRYRDVFKGKRASEIRALASERLKKLQQSM